MTDPLAHLHAKAAARAATINDIARILWENGDGRRKGMPTWDGLAIRSDAAARSWFLDRLRATAEALMALQPADALTLAQHLIASAMRSQEALELARGLEAGSLPGACGVAL